MSEGRDGIASWKGEYAEGEEVPQKPCRVAGRTGWGGGRQSHETKTVADLNAVP